MFCFYSDQLVAKNEIGENKKYFLDFFQKKFIYANVSLELKQKWFQNKNLPA